MIGHVCFGAMIGLTLSLWMPPVSGQERITLRILTTIATAAFGLLTFL